MARAMFFNGILEESPKIPFEEQVELVVRSLELFILLAILVLRLFQDIV